VRPLARVRPHVPLQQRGPVECFAARGTRPVAFLAAVLDAAVLAGGGQGCWTLSKQIGKKNIFWNDNRSS